MKKEDLEKEFDPFIDDKKKKTKDIVIDEEKKSSKPKNKHKKKIVIFQKNDSIDIVLIVIFASMLILTLFLGYKVSVAKKNHVEHVKSAIIVPVLGEATNNQISVDISKMKKNEERSYSFKVANNKDNNINPEEVVYGIQLLNTDNVEVIVYKNDSTENILGSDNLILDNKLAANKEQVDTYTLKIKAKKKTQDKDLLNIKIVS